jgi:crotonobetainyl-CoA:carnitine CoA-transferase CaiB-like acyl-CoA transferase
MKGSLAGIKVLDLSRLLPGPYCSMLLADHGAEVISIEDRRFEVDDLFFTSLYRNKKHLSLNLKSEEGKKIFCQLADRCDVLIEGFRPGVAARLGIDFDTLHQRFPTIVYCSISGYGQTGPWVDKAGHDINYLGTSGVLDLIGPAAGPPSIPGIQIADIGGSLNAVIGILLALLARNRSGKGQYVDISMTDSLLGFLSLPHYFYLQTGTLPKRSAELLSHRYGCYNTYETADGSAIAVGALEHRFWKELCTALAIDKFIDHQFDEARREEIIAELRTIFRTKSAEDWERYLHNLDVCCTRILDFDEVLNHPLFRDREMIVELEQPDGTTRKSLGMAIKLSGTPGSIRSGQARFGQHNEEILSGLGYSGAEIEQLRQRKVI